MHIYLILNFPLNTPCDRCPKVRLGRVVMVTSYYCNLSPASDSSVACSMACSIAYVKWPPMAPTSNNNGYLAVNYYKCYNLIGYATRYLLVIRYRVAASNATRPSFSQKNNAYFSFFEITLKK